MDGWQVAQNYLGFAFLAGGIGGYYYYTTKRTQPATAASRRRSTNDFKSKPDRRLSVQQREGAQPVASSEKQEKQSDATSSKKKKAAKKQQQPQQKPKVEPTPEVVVHDDKPERESDISVAQFAQQMTQARQGSKLAAPKSKENRVKTVKQGKARDTPIFSSESSQAGGDTGAEADDDFSSSPALNSGDVSDMLEPTPSGPSSIRLTAPLNPQKQRAPKQAKEEIVESKKARQNRKKVEERRIQREAEEKERKALEERQRRTAREARNEPAKNGIPVARAPASNSWNAAPATSGAAVNGASNGPLLDTFDAESTGSSTGGLENSTAATSTTEDAQVAQAVRESEDESGWTTVSVAKKQPKARAESSGEATPVEQPQPKAKAKANAPLPPKPSTFANVSKPTGFAALDVDDPSNWDA